MNYISFSIRGRQRIFILILTTLAALAATSRSPGSEDNVILIEPSKDEASREMSRRHSVANAFMIARVMSSVLRSLLCQCRIYRYQRVHVRSSTQISRLGLLAIHPHSPFQLSGEFVDLAWPVGCIVCETRELLRVRTILRARGQEICARRIAGGDELHMVGSEGEGH